MLHGTKGQKITCRGVTSNTGCLPFTKNAGKFGGNFHRVKLTHIKARIKYILELKKINKEINKINQLINMSYYHVNNYIPLLLSYILKLLHTHKDKVANSNI